MKLLVKATTFALLLGATMSTAGYVAAQARDHADFRPTRYGRYHGPGWRYVHGRWAYGPWGYGGPVPYGVYGYYGPPPVVAVPPPYPPVYEGAPPPPRRAAIRPAADKDFIVYFPFDGDQLTAQAQHIVQEAVQYQRSIPGTQVTIVGYTDAAGTEGYNQGLSQRRSEAVRQALASDGVGRSAIAMAWRGKHDQAVKTPDGVREPANRRVTIVVGGAQAMADRGREQPAQRYGAY